MALFDYLFVVSIVLIQFVLLWSWFVGRSRLKNWFPSKPMVIIELENGLSKINCQKSGYEGFKKAINQLNEYISNTQGRDVEQASLKTILSNQLAVDVDRQAATALYPLYAGLSASLVAVLAFNSLESSVSVFFTGLLISLILKGSLVRIQSSLAVQMSSFLIQLSQGIPSSLRGAVSKIEQNQEELSENLEQLKELIPTSFEQLKQLDLDFFKTLADRFEELRSKMENLPLIESGGNFSKKHNKELSDRVDFQLQLLNEIKRQLEGKKYSVFDEPERKSLEEIPPVGSGKEEKDSKPKTKKTLKQILNEII